MSRVVQSGTFQGRAIRKARRNYRCEYWRGVLGKCGRLIATGESYVEGEMKEGGNPFACQKWCTEHFKPEELEGPSRKDELSINTNHACR